MFLFDDLKYFLRPKHQTSILRSYHGEIYYDPQFRRKLFFREDHFLFKQLNLQTELAILKAGNTPSMMKEKDSTKASSVARNCWKYKETLPVDTIFYQHVGAPAHYTTTAKTPVMRCFGIVALAGKRSNSCPLDLRI